MAVNLIFTGSEISNTEETELRCFNNQNHEIFLQIKSPNCYPEFICLNLDTAVKFSKQLRKSIANIKNEY